MGTFVSVEEKEKQNIMTASGMFVSDAPPLIAISLSKKSMARRLIAKAKEFAVNIASTYQVHIAEKLGGTHGGTVDKLKKLKFQRSRPQRLSPRSSRTALPTSNVI